MLRILPGVTVGVDVSFGCTLEGDSTKLLSLDPTYCCMTCSYRISTSVNLTSRSASLLARHGQCDRWKSPKSHMPALARNHCSQNPRTSTRRGDIQVETSNTSNTVVAGFSKPANLYSRQFFGNLRQINPCRKFGGE